MKKTILSVFAVAFLLISCGGNGESGNSNKSEELLKSEQAIELKGFMLGGMYFFNGFGGVSTIENQLSNADSPKKMIEEYSEYFVLPFESSQASGIKSMFSNMWDINNADDLKNNLDKLKNTKNEENPHKAWDYARLVNNACMGYAAGYISKEEVKKIVSETLKLAETDFDSWEAYLEDYNKGRKTWDPEANDMEDFNKVTSDMLKNPKGLYATLKLN